MIVLDAPSWLHVAEEKQQEIYAAIPQAYLIRDDLLGASYVIDLPRRSGLLTARELRITESRAVDIVQRVRSREYSSVEVATAFCKRASIAHQAVCTG